MNNDNNSIRDYETTVRSSENLRDKMEGSINEPNRFKSVENDHSDCGSCPHHNQCNKSIQSID